MGQLLQQFLSIIYLLIEKFRISKQQQRQSKRLSWPFNSFGSAQLIAAPFTSERAAL